MLSGLELFLKIILIEANSLQYCSGFYHTSKADPAMGVHVPQLEAPSHLLKRGPGLGSLVAQR